LRSTLLRAARDRVFTCIGSTALILEFDEKLRAPHIARKLTPEQALEARELVFAL
jgi:hypothetical protein